MASLDRLLADAQAVLVEAGHGKHAAAVDAARKELARLLQPADGLCRLEIGTLLSAESKRGIVELVLNSEKTQMDLNKAREVLGMLSGAIEAAISDELVFTFLTSRVGLSPAEAAAALVDFRELRQGSRATVWAS